MNNELFTIRIMQIGEVDRVAELIRALQQHQKMKCCPRLPTGEDILDELTRQATTLTRETNRCGTHTLVAVDSSKSNQTDHSDVVGYLIYTESFSITNGRHIYINSFFIEQDYRRAGLGRRLLEYVRARAKLTGNSYVDVPVMNDNYSGLKFYANFGAYKVNEDYNLMIQKFSTNSQKASD